MTSVLLHLCPHTVACSLALACDAFQAANLHAGRELFRLLKVSVDGRAVQSAIGSLSVDGDLALAAQADILLLPAIGARVYVALAQDLALRQIQQEARMPVLRHVVVGNTPFDGFIVKGDLITCVEVTFLVTPIVSQEKINIVLKKVAAPMKSLKNLKIDARVRLLLVLVTQLDDAAEAQLRSSLVKKFGSTPVDVDIRLLDFEALQKIYAMD